MTACAAGTIPGFLQSIASQFAGRTAVVDERERLTYRQLEARSRLLAAELLGLGVSKYSRVGIHAPNSADWVVAWFAAARCGAVAVPVSTFATGPELVRILRHADCQVLIVRAADRRPHPADLLAGQVTDLSRRRGDGGHRVAALPFLRHVVDLGGTGNPVCCSVAERASAAAATSPALFAAAEREVHPSDPASMIYTSGSTSDPKGVIHSHRSITTQTADMARDLAFDKTTRNLTTMPFFWVGGLAMSLLPTLAMGGMQATTESIDPAHILQLVERERLERVFLYPPRTLAAVLEHPAYERADLSSVRRGTPGIPRDFEPAKGYSRTVDGLSMGLGMSETLGPYWWGVPDATDPYPPPLRRMNDGWEMRIVKDDGTDAGEGERGEIRVRGPHLTIGLQKTERSAVFDPDGYYRTGDIGLVEGGAVRFRGRGGDMIKVNGANVAAAEVVAALEALPGVAAAFVTALRHPTKGAEVGAAVVPETAIELDPDKVLDGVRRSLARYKVPSVLRVLDHDDVPMTGTGKLDQRRFAALLLDNDQEVRT